MANTQSSLEPLITLEDGRTFPVFDGEPLSWSIGLQFTFADEEVGYPKTRTVIRAMRDHYPEQFKKEKYETLKGSFDRIFGHVSRKLLAIMEEETLRYARTTPSN